MTAQGMIAQRSTVQLDGDFLVMEVIEYIDGLCRVDVVLRETGKLETKGTTVAIQTASSRELAVAKIARDFSTFATRALAWLPNVGQLVESYDENDEDEDEVR
jgi:hypothetical protein